MRRSAKTTHGSSDSYIPRDPESEVEVSSTRVEAARAGVSFGSALAIVISWSAHNSILWAIVHGIFSWFYVIYFAVTR